MKQRLILLASLILALFFPLMAEPVPAGYYNAINGTQDSTLKATLQSIISGGSRYYYGTDQIYHKDSILGTDTIWLAGDIKGYGTWTAFAKTDVKSDGTIWDMYSDAVRYYPIENGSACSMNIEHCLPKSWWGTGKNTDPIYRDLYNLNPSDVQANAQKSNAAPGHVNRGSKFSNGSFRMDKATESSYGYICFEPAEEYRGDFARTYFYMVTAYSSVVTWDSKYSAYVRNNTYKVFSDTLIQVLLDWHRSDHVSRKELERMNAISDIQHNRNCFIDYPELIEYIWGNKQGEVVTLANLMRTDSADYVPQESTHNLEIWEPRDVNREGFTATWSSSVAPYTLDVYTRSQSGRNDTIVNMPAVTHNLLYNQQHTTCSPKKSSNSFILQPNGTKAVTMGNGNIDGRIMLRRLSLTQPAQLVFRASAYNTASSAVLRIELGNTVLTNETIPVNNNTRDQKYYRYTIPAGTDSITITSVGGGTTKRACMQALYLIQGDLSVTERSLTGYPSNLSAMRAEVDLSTLSEGDTVYYHVTDANGNCSNEMSVVVPTSEVTTGLMNDVDNQHIRKELRNGKIVILNDNRTYSILGLQE